MADIIKNLNLNRHPKDVENLSLVDAQNIRISNDNNTIQSEETFNVRYLNSAILKLTNKLVPFYNNFYIAGVIPCNEEIILFVNPVLIKGNVRSDYVYVTRYKEKEQKAKFYKAITYNGGEYNGTFTYNVNNKLVITFCEYNKDGGDSPLSTIVLDDWDDTTVFNENYYEGLIPSSDYLYEDRYKHSLNPEVKIPYFTINSYIQGTALKGQYNLFIRFKINKTDYTRWFHLGYSFYIGDANKVQIEKVFQYKTEDDKSIAAKGTGYVDILTDSTTTSFLTANCNIKFANRNYDYFQLAFVNQSNDKTIIKSTDDLKLSSSSLIYEFTINLELFKQDIALEDLTLYENYFNVEHIINYGNRTYIANYETIKDIDENYNISDNVELYLSEDAIQNDEQVFIVQNSEGNYQIESQTNKEIDLTDLSGLVKDSTINIVTYKENEYIEVITNNTTFGDVILIKNDGSLTDNTLFEVDFLNHDATLYSRGIAHKGKISVSIADEEDNVRIRATISIPEKNGVGPWLFTGNELYPREAINPTFRFKKVSGPSTFIFDTKTPVNADDYTFSFNADGDNYIIKDKDGNIYNNSDIVTDYNKPVLTVGGVTKFFPFINSTKELPKRLKQSSLIGGEIYNFFIHFVDKYGNFTKGHRIDNNKLLIKATNFNIDDYDNPFIFKCEVENGSILNFIAEGNALIKVNGNLNTKAKVLPVMVKNIIENAIPYLTVTRLNTNAKPLFNWLDINSTLRFQDLISNFDVDVVSTFLRYTNIAGDNFFAIPYKFPRIIDDIENTGIVHNQYFINNLVIKVKTLPKGYVGYFLSYEKLEKRIKTTGIISRKDGNTNNDDVNDSNNKLDSKMYFFSEEYDILDNIDLNYTYGFVYDKLSFLEHTANDGFKEPNINFLSYDRNYPPINKETKSIFFNLKESSIQLGGDITKQRFGKSTTFAINRQIDVLDDSGKVNILEAALIFSNNNIYTNSEKTLIKFTNVINKIGKTVLKEGFNGYYTWSNIPIFNDRGVIINDNASQLTDLTLKNWQLGTGTTSNFVDNVYNAFITVIPQLSCNTYFKEFKQIKTDITSYTYWTEDASDKKDVLRKMVKGSWVSPEQMIDLFEHKYNNLDIIRTYDNFRKDIQYIYKYDKTIRRSNIIQDESPANKWRQFELENYKMISENKGKITNLAAIGTIFLIHTEHSLFILNRDNQLKTDDTAVQLQMPDIFDIDYKEIITSNLGYGGLKTKEHAILDTFGYIYYDYDNKIILRYDAGQLMRIDTYITEFLRQLNIIDLRLIHLLNQNRILFNFKIKYDEIENNQLLSFNYVLNRFISRHTYNFNKGFNTKNYSYQMIEEQEHDFPINKILEQVDDIFNNHNLINQKPIISIIVNERYEAIKYLEFIRYKLYKFVKDSIIVENDFDNHMSKEEIKTPYRGARIRIYNNECDTGNIDIEFTNIASENSYNEIMDIDKPYWEQGNWNFNYIFNNKNSEEYLDLLSRVYGNYFIIEIQLFNNKNLIMKHTFETLEYFVSSNRNI